MAKPNFETQQSKCPRAEYASGDFEIRHRFTLTASYEIPGPKGFGQLLRGWKLNSIVNLQTAQRWIAFDAANNFSGSFDNADRWNYYGNPADFQSGSSSIPYCSGPGDCSVTSGISGIQNSFSSLRFRRDVAAVRVGRARLQRARERRLLRERQIGDGSSQEWNLRHLLNHPIISNPYGASKWLWRRFGWNQ